MSSLTSEKHRAELEQFGELLLQEAYEVHLVPAAGEVPYDTLLVKLESFEKANRVWWLELSFLAGLEDELDDVSILQCYVALSERTAGENTSSLERLIVKLNAKLPIGGFGLLDNPRVLFFKHNAMLPNDNQVAGFQIVHELVAMIGYLIGVFSEPLIKIASGEMAAEDAMPFRDVIGSSSS
jgi:hypothetical protein